MKTIVNFIFFSTAVGIGATLGHLGLNLSDWEVWVIMGCAVIANCCGTIKALMSSL